MTFLSGSWPWGSPWGRVPGDVPLPSPKDTHPMPYNVPRTPPDPEPEVSREQMLAIREDVRQKLIKQYHSHRLTARLYRNIGKDKLSLVEETTMADIKRMIDQLAAEGAEGIDPDTVRLLEHGDGS